MVENGASRNESLAPRHSDSRSAGAAVEKAGVFLLVGQEKPVSPATLGAWVVRWAMDSSEKTIERFSNDSMTEFGARIAAKPRRAQMHVIALEAAATYVYASEILSVPDIAKTEMISGIRKTIEALAADTSSPSLFLTEFMRQISEYSVSLLVQLSTLQNSDAFKADISTTLHLVVRNIATDYEATQFLDGNPMEEESFQLVALVHEGSHFEYLRDVTKLRYSAIV